MDRRPKHYLPPNLERQLSRIELVGNAEAELLAQETADYVLDLSSPVSNSNLSISEQQHRIDTAREQFLRETKRTKMFGLVLLALAPLAFLTYFASIYYDNALLAFASMLFSGLLFGFGIVVIMMARRNMNELKELGHK